MAAARGAITAPWLLHTALELWGRGDVLVSPRRYVGELISDSEADVREEDSYLFDLDNKVTRSEGLDIKV